MSHSSLVTYVKLSPYNSGPRGHAIDSIAIHCLPLYRTDLLTKNGWVSLADIKVGDVVATCDNTCNISFEPITSIVDSHIDDVYNFSTGFCGTYNHRLLLKNQYDLNHSKAYKDGIVGDVLKRRSNLYLPQCGYYKSSGLDITDDELNFICATQADGSYEYFDTNGFVTSIRFRFWKQRKIDTFISLINRLGYTYEAKKIYGTKSYEYGIGIRINDVNALHLCHEYLNQQKEFTYKFLELSDGQAIKFIDYLTSWDGTVVKHKGCIEKRFISHKPNNIDVVSAIACIHGIGFIYDTKHTTIVFKNRPYRIFGDLKKVITTKELVSCVSVPSGYILIRQNRRPALVGNCMAGNMTVERCAECFQPHKRSDGSMAPGASSNYGIGSDGRIACYVEEENRAWTTSDGSVRIIDKRAITIEVANSVNNGEDPNWPVTDEAFEALINLCVDICRRNNIPGLRWKADKEYGLKAAVGGSVTEQNMFAHRWVAAKACPGDYLYSKFGELADEVNKRLDLNIPLQNTSTVTKKILFVGDSRTTGMHNAVGDDGNVWSAKIGAGRDWMINTGIPNIENYVNANTAIVILIGINDVLGSAKPLYTYINSKSPAWKSKGADIYFVSLNPVSVGVGNVYGITNADVEKYNNDMKSNLSSDVIYIDTYSALKDQIVILDGLHYDAESYRKIYQVITSQIGSTSPTVAISGTIDVDYTQLNPYLLTLDRNSPDNIDFNLLKSKKVVGAIVEAVDYYSSYGKAVDQFENPKILNQVTALKQADMPYGLYLYAKAHTVKEANNEMYRMMFPINRYGATLGVWLLFGLGNNFTVNNQILDKYKRDLINMGFKQRMGIICTRNQLKLFDWETYQNDFYLWLVEHITNLNQLDRLLDPEFFDTDGK